MSNEIFNFDVDSPFEEDVRFLTIISEGEGGAEQRYQKWLKPRRTFRIKLEARNESETDDLWRMYIRHKGSFDTFLFQNPNENPVINEIIGSGDGATSVFYFGNSVSLGTGDSILVPDSETIKRSIGGTGDFLSFTAYTNEDSFGQITTNTVLPSGDVLRADSYRFYYRVRFREDQLTREAFTANLWRVGLELEEVI